MKSVVILLLALLAVSCGSDDSKNKKKLEAPTAVLHSESDSLSYVIGVSMAQNILKVDSLIDLTIVGAAIAQYGEGKALFTAENARAAYLKYLLHVEPERQRAYEAQYLKELSIRDRDYTQTRSGITYNISVIGNESVSPRNSGDWVEINYTISRLDGEKLYSTLDEGEQTLSGALSSMPRGVMECVKLLGKGGEMTALIPSILTYDSEGEPSLGIKPFETLRYDIELVDSERNAANRRSKPRDPATF